MERFQKRKQKVFVNCGPVNRWQRSLCAAARVLCFLVTDNIRHHTCFPPHRKYGLSTAKSSQCSGTLCPPLQIRNFASLSCRSDNSSNILAQYLCLCRAARNTQYSSTPQCISRTCHLFYPTGDLLLGHMV